MNCIEEKRIKTKKDKTNYSRKRINPIVFYFLSEIKHKKWVSCTFIINPIAALLSAPKLASMSQHSWIRFGWPIIQIEQPSLQIMCTLPLWIQMPLFPKGSVKSRFVINKTRIHFNYKQCYALIILPHFPITFSLKSIFNIWNYIRKSFLIKIRTSLVPSNTRKP